VLANSGDGSSGTNRATPLKVEDAATSRGEMQVWLKWKAPLTDTLIYV
jgi:hypothetical protein